MILVETIGLRQVDEMMRRRLKCIQAYIGVYSHTHRRTSLLLKVVPRLTNVQSSFVSQCKTEMEIYGGERRRSVYGASGSRLRISCSIASATASWSSAVNVCTLRRAYHANTKVKRSKSAWRQFGTKDLHRRASCNGPCVQRKQQRTGEKVIDIDIRERVDVIWVDVNAIGGAAADCLRLRRGR